MGKKDLLKLYTLFRGLFRGLQYKADLCEISYNFKVQKSLYGSAWQFVKSCQIKNIFSDLLVKKIPKYP